MLCNCTRICSMLYFKINIGSGCLLERWYKCLQFKLIWLFLAFVFMLKHCETSFILTFICVVQ